ncbi:hypothetical protein [Zavarzinia sp. CC-PAN008]|uniref:hypothetical protein n=1 Tax=Zavarzinia sp. CC-PAN008 TaxID=3243332 RepID=UPI003F7430E3
MSHQRAQVVPPLLQIGINVRAVPEPRFPLARDLMALWRQRDAEGARITRADVPSRPLLRFMPFIILFEPINDGDDWLFRLVGSEIRQRFGVELTGMTIRGLYEAEEAAGRAAHYRRLTLGGVPMVTRGRVLGVDRDFMDVEFCDIPLPGRDPLQPWLMTGVFLAS